MLSEKENSVGIMETPLNTGGRRRLGKKEASLKGSDSSSVAMRLLRSGSPAPIMSLAFEAHKQNPSIVITGSWL